MRDMEFNSVFDSDDCAATISLLVVSDYFDIWDHGVVLFF